jgi:hypothetical protein
MSEETGMNRELIHVMYAPQEIVVLDEFFDVDRAQRLEQPDFLTSCNQLGCADSLPSMFSPAAAAAAKIVLGSVQESLPNWGSVRSNGEVLVSRDTGANRHRGAEQPAVSFEPQFLFLINWADSGPGFSWPMGYYVTWLPGYERYVVTSSSDSPEGNHGYCDLAIDYLGRELDLLQECASIIEGDWSGQLAEWDQPHWQCLLNPGLLNGQEVEAMGNRVWEPDEEEDEEWDEENET